MNEETWWISPNSKKFRFQTFVAPSSIVIINYNEMCVKQWWPIVTLINYILQCNILWLSPRILSPMIIGWHHSGALIVVRLAVYRSWIGIRSRNLFNGILCVQYSMIDVQCVQSSLSLMYCFFFCSIWITLAVCVCVYQLIAYYYYYYYGLNWPKQKS